MHHRLPHLDVVEGRLAHVEDEVGLRREHLPALGGVLHVGQPAQALDVDVVHVAAAQGVDAAALERHRARGRVRDHVEDQLVQVGLAFLPVVGIALQLDVFAALPFLELEGAGADGFLVGRVGGVVGARVDVLGHHGREAGLEHQHEGGKGRLQAHHDRVVVDLFDLVEEFAQDHARPGVGLGQQVGQREDDVVGRERLAIVPLDAFLQMEGVAQAVGRGFPGLGQAGLRLEIERIGQQAFIDLAGDELGRPLLVERGDQDRRLGLHDQVERAAPGLGMRVRQRKGRRQGKGGCGQFEELCEFHCWPPG
ncbi:hypothetical protein L531_1831 [Bordetella bronchiseptica MO275]|nr:hypothetical protein L531_1831 [Bordetella bronchiseptica MO275]